MISQGNPQVLQYSQRGHLYQDQINKPRLKIQKEHKFPTRCYMTRAGVNKYMKVFMEVDSDRDGKITGYQARSLFLSWRLPREILKKVWDVSDQDNDNMLSLREFSITLYLMERYREGQNLPPTLPSNVLLLIQGDAIMLSGAKYCW